MVDIISRPIFGISITLITYLIGLYLKKKSGKFYFQPILVSLILIIVFLKIFKISYEGYNVGGQYISYLLKPATVALAIPMYKKIHLLKEKALIILATTFFSALLGVLLVYFLGWFTGADKLLIFSMIPKAVTTPIAVGISEEIGGEISLTGGMVIFNGLLGGMFGIKLHDLFRIKSQLARGLSMGISAHGIGTARILEESEFEGAVSVLAIGLMGFFTAVIVPIFVALLN